MAKETKSFGRSFRFTTSRGQTLTDRITEIEALASKQLRSGVDESAVMEDAIALLGVACTGLHSGPAASSTPQPAKPQGLARQPAKTHKLARAGTTTGGDDLRHLQPIPRRYLEA